MSCVIDPAVIRALRSLHAVSESRTMAWRAAVLAIRLPARRAFPRSAASQPTIYQCTG